MVYFDKERDSFSISTDPARLDVAAVHAYLTRSYWAEGIPLEIVAKSIEASVCFGLFDNGRQIGFARVVTDKATFAYLCDVYVLEEYQGRGLGTWLMEAVCSYPEIVPNGPMPLAIGPCLEYSIYHGPLPFIRTLLEIGADPNPTDHAGFPPLIAVLSTRRPDVPDVIRLLLSFGADPNQRGHNDYTPLHMAVAERNLTAIPLLLEGGADPRLRTRIDDCETAREMAENAGLPDFVELLSD